MNNPNGQIVISIHNEDSGKEYQVDGGPGTPVRVLIEELYRKKLNTERKNDDRLRCEASGDDVFQHSDMHLRDYVSQHCADRAWLFASGTGGALC